MAPSHAWPRAGREGGTPCPGSRWAVEAQARAWKVSSKKPGAGSECPLRVPALPSGAARLFGTRGCPSSPRPLRRPARGSGEKLWPGAPARAAGPRGGGEINNARKRKTDVSRARASPASRRGCAPARAPRRRRLRRCSDSSSPSSEAIVYWALNHLLIHPRGRRLPDPGGPCSLLILPASFSQAAGRS